MQSCPEMGQVCFTCKPGASSGCSTELDLAYQGLLASPEMPCPTWNFSSNLASEVCVFLSPRLRASLFASSSFCAARTGTVGVHAAYTASDAMATYLSQDMPGELNM